MATIFYCSKLGILYTTIPVYAIIIIAIIIIAINQLKLTNYTNKRSTAMEKKPVKIVETVLRDGHQSLAATRMRISDMLPALEQLDNAGYYALEAWGGL